MKGIPPDRGEVISLNNTSFSIIQAGDINVKATAHKKMEHLDNWVKLLSAHFGLPHNSGFCNHSTEQCSLGSVVVFTSKAKNEIKVKIVLCLEAKKCIFLFVSHRRETAKC